MNTTEIKALRAKIDAAHAADTAGEWSPMNTETPNLDAAIAEIGKDQFSILLACEDAIKAAGPLPTRERICEVCTGLPFWQIHHVAEAIYSAAGLSDAMAFQAGRLGIHTDTERHGDQFIAVAL